MVTVSTLPLGITVAVPIPVWVWVSIAILFPVSIFPLGFGSMRPLLPRTLVDVDIPVFSGGRHIGTYQEYKPVVVTGGYRCMSATPRVL